MNGILLGTCTFAWMLLGRQHLSATAQLAIDGASENLFVSAVTFYEINQKVRLGRWDEMIPYAGDLISLTRLSSSQILQLDGQICAEAGAMAWDHRDPFDRLIAVTALRNRLLLVSADKRFAGIVARIW